ncbi:hypothetical protein ACLOJK_004909 [Asimina triloba]
MQNGREGEAIQAIDEMRMGSDGVLGDIEIERVDESESLVNGIENVVEVLLGIFSVGGGHGDGAAISGSRRRCGQRILRGRIHLLLPLRLFQFGNPVGSDKVSGRRLEGEARQ